MRDRRRLTRAGTVLLAGALLVAAAGGSDGIEEFLGRHWRRPIPPQGRPPARFTPIEASLQPESCGTCHPAQLADWRTSLHSKSMGPGVAGQLVEMVESDPATALSCLACHAPLGEQAPLVAEGERFKKNPVFDAGLRDRGLACAGCHVRGHERFGPPRRDGTLASAARRETLPHNGVTRTRAFVAAEFCRGCHQFTPDGYALNGKLLENTYTEWKASRFAREGVQCQDCHMPDRRHLWRGIHDPDMVRSGLTITATTGAARYRPGDTAVITLRVQSTRIGHAFPTYVTPRVVLGVELVDGAGRAVPGSYQDKVIAREITLDLAREISDTRLLPGQTATLELRRRIDRPGLKARLTVIVEPDAFYARFFATLLRQGAGRGAAQIREALEASRRAVFTLFERELPLS
ncbi:MAG: hypothetical protein HY728_00570 [Candidatus Rokubacteria bacterium]|nr:hypothetical protein [Candidatus Rokubacteria bacterium]